MRWTLDAAEPARFALLGLLLEGPRHGYDLARRFAPGTALGDVVHLGSSHLYALLARLQRDGLVVGEVQESPSRPARRVYHLTADGRSAVQRWVAEPVARPRDVLVDFPLKLYLARRISPEGAAALVARQRELFAAYLQRLESAATQPAGDEGEGESEDAAFTTLLRRGRIARTRATLEWLDDCAREAVSRSRQLPADGYGVSDE